MIKFYSGSSFVNHGDGIYFIAPTSGVPFVQTVVGGTVTKIAELNNGYSKSEIDAIEKELSDAIKANAANIKTVADALKVITDAHGTQLEKLEQKVTNNATSISNIVDGTTTVAKALNATSAVKAENAVKASQDADGNVIASTYATQVALKEAKDYVGTFTAPEGSSGVDTVVKYIDEKTKNVASDATVQQIQQDLDKIEVLFDENGKALKAVNADNAAVADVANKTQASLTVGGKTFDGSVAVEIKAEDLGLDNALHFLGTSTSAITDGGSEIPTIAGWSGAPVAGDIVLYDGKEYIWTAADAWELFGDEGSYVVKTRSVSAGSGLTGGGNLSNDISIAHAVPSGAGTSKNVVAAAGKYISGITFDEFGHVVDIATAQEKVYEGAKGIEIAADGKVQHTNSVTAGTAQGSAGTVGFGDTINIPSVTYDAQGHITGSSTTTVTLPSDTPITNRLDAIENTLVWYDANSGAKL